MRLPPVQQVSRSAHGAAGSGLPGSVDTPGGAGRQARHRRWSLAHAPALRAAGLFRLRRAAPGLASASRRREGARPARSGACGSARPFVPRIFCALRAQRRRHDESGVPGISRRRQERKDPELAAVGGLPVGWRHLAEPQSRRASTMPSRTTAAANSLPIICGSSRSGVSTAPSRRSAIRASASPGDRPVASLPRRSVLLPLARDRIPSSFARRLRRSLPGWHVAGQPGNRRRPGHDRPAAGIRVAARWCPSAGFRVPRGAGVRWLPLIRVARCR
jgi:hypothetical protein